MGEPNFHPLELFPVIIGTMSIALSFFVISQVFGIGILNFLAELLFLIVAVTYVISLSWSVFNYTIGRISWRNDFKNPARLSMMSFAAVIFYASGFFYIQYFGLNNSVAELLSTLFIIVWFFVFTLNLRLAYLIYNGQIRMSDITYLIIIPSIVLGAGIIITSVLLPYRFLSEGVNISFSLYMLSLVGFGISVIQFFLLSSISLFSNILNQSGIRKAGTTMIPLGAASIIILNLILFPTFNDLKILYFPERFSIDLSIGFWGFEIFVMVTGLLTAFKTIGGNHDISVWAYVFPVGISIFSDYLLFLFTGFAIFRVSIIAVSAVLFGMYSYSVYHTRKFLRSARLVAGKM